MADKRATVYVVDLGKSMNEKNEGRGETDLEYSEHYLWDRITSTVANGRKTDNVCVVAYRTNESDNALAKDDESYRNISVLSPMSQFLMPNIRELKKRLDPSKTDNGDDIIATFCKHLKYTKNIVLITNGTGEYNFEDMDEIVKQVHDQNITITVIGVDFDDEEYGFKESNKSKLKGENEHSIKAFVDACNGTVGTAAEAIEELQRPRTKVVRPVPSYRGALTIGDSSRQSKPFVSIDVERYPRTMVAKAPTASAFAMKGRQGSETDTTDAPSSSTQRNSELQEVRLARTYQVDDSKAPGGKADVDIDDLSKGYMYGRTVVPLSASDQEVVKFETFASLQIIGFVPKDSFPRFLSMSCASIIVASKTNDKAAIALSSLIHALYELDTLALARLVTKMDKAPVLTILAPSIEPDLECLVDVQVPFAEDIRHYKFAPFSEVKTLSGKVLDTHRFIPSESLVEAMSDYVDCMTIDENESSDENEEFFSPILHRINQVISWRATHPDDSNLPEIPKILKAASEPSTDLVKESKEDLARLVKVSEVKKVPQKAKGKGNKREFVKPVSGLDVEELLENRNKVSKIDPEFAIPQFKQIVHSLPGPESEILVDAVGQMSQIIKNKVKNSVSDSSYGQALECLKVVREECVEIENWRVYNKVIREFRDALLQGSLGGDRKDLWSQLRKQKLGLVTSEEDANSTVSLEEARKVPYSPSRQLDEKIFLSYRPVPAGRRYMGEHRVVKPCFVDLHANWN